MKHHFFKPFIIAAAAIFALSSCSSPAAPSTVEEPLEAVDLVVGFDNPLAYSNNIPVLIAIDQGFFEEQGLNVTTVGFSGGSDATRALVSESIDVQAGVGFDSVVANANGLDVKIFYTIARDSDFVLYGSEAAGVGAPQDLKSKSIGVSAFGSFTDYLARSTPSAVGLPNDSVETLALGTNPALFGAIESGEIGGTWNPSSLAGAINGSTILGSTKDFGIPTQYSSLIARGDWLKENTDVANRFATAVAAAIAWHQDKANRDAAVALGVSVMTLPEGAASAAYDAAFGIFTEDGKPNVTGLTAMADAVPDLDLAPTSPNVDDLYSNDYLPKG